MRARWWMASVVGLPWLCMCSLSGLDGLAGGATASDAGGSDAPHVADASDVVVSTDGAGWPEGGGRDAGPSYADLVLADHPVAYFPFDEASGGTSVLEKITGKLGTIVAGKPTFGVPGIAGTALRSSGDTAIDFGQLVEFTGTHAFTFEAWIYPVVNATQVFYEYFNKRDGTTNGIVIYVRHENGHTTAQLEDDYAAGGGRGADIELPPLDHFIHIVHVYDPSVGVRAWADGVPGNVGYNDPGGPTPNGVHVFVASGIQGTIDEMAIYDYALSDAQIAAHFKAGKK